MAAVSMEARRGHCVPWHYSCKWLCAAQDGCLENADHDSGTSVGKVSPARMTKKKGKGQCRSRGDVFPKFLGRKE